MTRIFRNNAGRDPQRINAAVALTRGCVFAYLPYAGMDVISRTVPTVAGTNAATMRSGSPRGMASRFAGGADGTGSSAPLNFGVLPGTLIGYDTSNPVTILVYGECFSSNKDAIVTTTDVSSNSKGYYLGMNLTTDLRYMRKSTGNQVQCQYTIPTQLVGVPVALAIAHDGALLRSGVTCVMNGLTIAENGTGTDGSVGSVVPVGSLRIGSTNENALGNQWLGTCNFVAIFNRLFTPAECVWWSRNPMSIFEPLSGAI